MAREPGFCLHKPTGQAYVNLGGRVIYLGTYGTDKSKSQYNKVKAEWLVTPTMIIADVEGNVLEQVQGTMSKSEFLTLLQKPHIPKLVP